MDKVISEKEAILSKKEQQDKFFERYLNKSRKIVSKSFQELDSLPGVPEEFDYFRDILRKIFIDNELVCYKDNEIFVTSFCVMFPSEIIRAAGARPLTMCSANFIGSGRLGGSMPVVICPQVRALSENIKLRLDNAVNKSDIFIIPLTCDCKKMLQEELKIEKPTFKLQIPSNRFDDEGINLYTKQIKSIANEISKITGIKITRQSLAREIRLYAEAQREIERFNELKSNDDILIRGTHALIVMNSLAYDDLSCWVSHLKKLNDELTKKKENQLYLTKKKLPRILLISSSITFPNIKIPLIIEQLGGVIVSCQSCLGDKPYDDYISVSENDIDGYYRALANRCVKPCSCSTFPNSDVTINKVKEIINQRKIDGIIYSTYQGCITAASEFEILSDSLKEKGVPILKVETDLFSEDIELLKVRIGAFIEMLTFKKQRS